LFFSFLLCRFLVIRPTNHERYQNLIDGGKQHTQTSGFTTENKNKKEANLQPKMGCARGGRSGIELT
jgi:hypothetical protein